jgi:hypothetical protein
VPHKIKRKVVSFRLKVDDERLNVGKFGREFKNLSGIFGRVIFKTANIKL